MENLFLLLDSLFTGANPDNLELFYDDFFNFHVYNVEEMG